MKQLFLINLFLILIASPQILFAMKVSEQQHKQQQYKHKQKQQREQQEYLFENIRKLAIQRDKASTELKTIYDEIDKTIDQYDSYENPTKSTKEQRLIIIGSVDEIIKPYTKYSEKLSNIFTITENIIANYQLLIKNDSSTTQNNLDLVKELQEEKDFAERSLIELAKNNNRKETFEKNQSRCYQALKKEDEQKLTPATILITSSFITTALGYCVYKFLGIFF